MFDFKRPYRIFDTLDGFVLDEPFTLEEAQEFVEMRNSGYHLLHNKSFIVVKMEVVE